MPNNWIFKTIVFIGNEVEDVDIYADIADYNNGEHLKFYNKYDGRQVLVASFPYGKIAIVSIVDPAAESADSTSGKKIEHNVSDI